MKTIYNLFTKGSKIILFLQYFLLISSLVKAEGTKQLSPTATDRVNLNLCSTSYNSFGRYDGNADQRLSFHIENTATEQVFLGFSQPRTNTNYPCSAGNATAYFRIKDATGTVVFPTVGSSSGQAITPVIADWAGAVAGPNQIVGSGGYNAIVFDPAGLQAGDYYVEFSTNQSAYSATAFAIEWWDITVATKTAPTAINGRVFAKNWAFYVPSPTCSTSSFGCVTPNQFGAFDGAFNGAFHVYSSVDSLVTNVDFNNSGLRPVAFNIFFNDRGPGTSGNITEDRKSVNNALVSSPKYPLFLNNPDEIVYPSGSIGTFETDPFVVSCDNQTGQFFVTVTKPGQIEVLVDLDTGSGAYKYDMSSRDVVLALKVTPQVGELPPYRRQVYWNGKDGFGTQFDLSQPFNFSVNYTQGIFHLPIYDAEFMTGGFTFHTERPMPPPAAMPINIYYDDSNIPDDNLNGSSHVELNGKAAPAHTWNSGCYGDANTLNTWFYGSEERRSRSERAYCLVEGINDTATVTASNILLPVLNNDGGVALDSNSLSITGSLQPLHGTISLDPINHTITYTPTVGYIGTDNFQYIICDSARYSCDTAVVVLTMPACVSPPTGGATSYTGGSVCSGANAGTVTLSGHSGNITQWQTSTNGGSTWTNIANTAGNTTYNFTNAVNNQEYRAAIDAFSGSCPTAYSTSSTITVLSSPVLSSVTPVNPTCPSVTNGTITVNAAGSNNQYSKDNGSTWQASNSFTGLVGGSYILKVRDSLSNCEVTYSSNPVVLTAPYCNQSPTITSPTTANFVENATTVAYTVTATDPDSVQTKTYSFETGGVDNAQFNINPTTGDITFVASPDFESPTDNNTDNVYNIKIKVCDNGSPVLCATQNVAITVTNLNDTEICGNQIDDDGDGRIDGEDPKCPDPICTNTTGLISATITGQNTGAGFTQKYALTDSTGKILRVVNTPSVSVVVSGKYRLYALNYDTTGGITNLAINQNIANVAGACLNISLPLLYKICYIAPVEICGNLLDDEDDGKIDCEDSDCAPCSCTTLSNIVYTPPSTNPTANHTRRYVLTNDSGVIQKVSLLPIFLNCSDGQYRVYTVWYVPATYTPPLSMGVHISAVTGASVVVSLPKLEKVCVPLVRYETRIVEKAYDCWNKKITIQVQVRAKPNTGTFLMGDANYRFDYNSTQLTNPVIISQEHFSNIAPASDANYVPQTLNGSSEGPTIGTVSLNTVYAGGGLAARTVDSTWQTVSCIQFTKRDTALCYSFRWHDQNESPSTGMTGIDIKGGGNYESYYVTSGNYYGNYQYCLTDLNCCTAVNMKAMLEGPFNSGTGLMSTVLNQRGLLPGQTPIGGFAIPTPAGQPYISSPWFYNGSENVTNYPPTVVDWVLVSFRTAPVLGSTVLRAAGLLHNNGAITFPNPCHSLPIGSYYIVIEHRNHLGIMSPTAVPVLNDSISFDFTTAQSYVLTNPPSFGQKNLSNFWVMYAADGSKANVTSNYDINFGDSLLWKSESGVFDQYRYGDFNLDADMNFDDSVLWKLNNGRYSGVPH